jgi:hypothetical protein
LISPATVAMISNPRKEMKTIPVVARTPRGPKGANGSRFPGSMKNKPTATKTRTMAVSTPMVTFWNALDSSVP